MSERIIEKLDQLGELQAQKDLLEIKKQELIDSVLTPEIKQQLQDIEEETWPEFEAIAEKQSALTDEIKDSVLDAGESIKGAVYHAVWVKGRVSWNDKALMQYLEMHPELAYLRTVGNPSVSIRKAK
jgi:hypothetical protein